MLRNVITVVALIALSGAYLWASPFIMPGGTNPLIVVGNLIAAPFIAGSLGGYFMLGRLLPKLIALLLVPITHIPLYGEDPAKPGIENLVALLEVLPIWLGCVVTHVLTLRKTVGASTSSRA